MAVHRILVRLRVGELVDVINERLHLVAVRRVAYSGRRIVRTDDGRGWRSADGCAYDIDGKLHPFPFIKRSRKQRPRAYREFVAKGHK